jgi:hypothetical protein
MFYDVQYPCESTASTFHPPNPWYSLKVRAVTAVKLVSERRWDEKQRKFPSRTYPRRFSPVQDIRPWSCFGIRMGLDSVAFRSVMKICEICTNEHGIQSEIAMLRLWGWTSKNYGPGALRTFQSTYTSQWNRDHIREEQ